MKLIHKSVQHDIKPDVSISFFFCFCFCFGLVFVFLYPFHRDVEVRQVNSSIEYLTKAERERESTTRVTGTQRYFTCTMNDPSPG